MKLLLTHAYFLADDEKEKWIQKPYPPLGILSIAAYLDSNAIETNVYDSTFGSETELLNKIHDLMPEAIGFYVNLMTRVRAIQIIKKIKVLYPNLFVFVGGPETRHYANEFLSHQVDLVVIGEGEETCLEICNNIESLKNKKIVLPGTAILLNGQTHFGDERKLMKDLDALPFPARNKIDINKYLNFWKEKHGYSMINVSTMRGCPYTCKWCSRAVYGGTYRRRSVQSLLEEIKHLQKNYSFDKIWFVDDVFTISHKWLKDFNELIQKEKINISYEIISRSDRLNDDCLVLLKTSGCFRIWIGAESGSQKIIDAMDRRVKISEVQKMIRAAKQIGIETGTFIMLGYPGEDWTDISETVKHLKNSNPDLYTFTIAYPIKGTELYNEVKNDITVLPEWDVAGDRSIEFKRKYPKIFYEWALRYVNNDLEAFRNKGLKKIIPKIKSILAQLIMSVITLLKSETETKSGPKHK